MGAPRRSRPLANKTIRSQFALARADSLAFDAEARRWRPDALLGITIGEFFYLGRTKKGMFHFSRQNLTHFD